MMAKKQGSWGSNGGLNPKDLAWGMVLDRQALWCRGSVKPGVRWGGGEGLRWSTYRRRAGVMVVSRSTITGR